MKRKFTIAVLATSLLFGSGSGALLNPNMMNNLSFAGTVATDIIDADDIDVRRTMDGTYTFTFKEIGKWDIYASKDPTNFKDAKLLKSTTASKVSFNLNPSVRYYFKAVNKKGATIVSERLINLEGEENMRDMGGFVTEDGRTLKWGKIYRAGALNELTDKDRVLYDSLEIGTIIDFRTADEHKIKPDNVPKSTNLINAPIMPGDFRIENIAVVLKNGDMEEARKMFVEPNRGDDSRYYNESLKKFFRAVETNEDALLYHCAGGKDRTGLASALFLHALGVDRETIINDYMDTNMWREHEIEEKLEKGKKRGWDEEVTLLINVCTREKFDELIGMIEERYGTVDHYLVNVLDVDIAKLRDLYLD